MKKITQSATTGGAPIYIDDFKDVFNLELWDVIESKFAGFDSDTQGIIVSGCAISGSVGNYTIADGIVYLDGEFRRFASQSGLSLPQYIKAATDVNTTRTFEDTSTKTLYITKSADLATSAPGTQYVAFTSTTSANARRLDSGWVNITLNASGGASYIAGTRTPQYRVKNGVIYLRGIISTSGSPPLGDHAVSGAAAVPIPGQRQDLSNVNSAFTTIASFYIDTNGTIRADSSVAWGGSVVLDGMSYLL